VNGSACVATPSPNNVDMDWGRTSVTALTGATCGAPTGAQPTGTVTADASKAFTVCCPF
jgi:hypothetical protein